MPLFAPGKVMITGEYAVLKGSLALAVPTIPGQTLEVSETDSPYIRWKALSAEDHLWLQVTFSPELEILETTDPPASERLQRLLLAAGELGATFHPGLSFTTGLQFPAHWGLGSSSSLLALLARWADLDPWELFDRTQTGSGYDLAVAWHNRALLYRRFPEREVEFVHWNPPFTDLLYFLELGSKQRSDLEVARINNLSLPDSVKASVDLITREMLSVSNPEDFGELMQRHEALIGSWLNMPGIDQRLPHLQFPMKSLGAWGGDLVLILAEPEKNWTAEELRGLNKPIPWKTLIQ